MVRPRAAAVAVFIGSALLTACGGSSAVDAAQQGGGGGSSSQSSQWTTLGTRTALAVTQPAPVVGSGPWVDYNPAVLYPNTVTDNNQFLTMADGTRLAASVTFPADASGK